MKEEGMVALKCKKCGGISTWYAILDFKCFICPYCGGTEYETLHKGKK